MGTSADPNPTESGVEGSIVTGLRGAKTSRGCVLHPAVITGAGGDLGRELAVRLAARGVPVALADSDHDRLDATLRACDQTGDAVTAWPVDVTAPDQVTQVAEAIGAQLGPAHALYNLAGVIHAGLLIDSNLTDLDRVIQVDLLGTIACSQAFLPQLVASGHGRLVNVSSAFGLIGVPGYSAYAAAKFGVRGFSEALQQELDPMNITVSVVYLGGVQTGIMRRGTYASSANPEQIQRTFDEVIARTSAAQAAARILHGVEQGRRRILVGPDARLVDVLVRVAGSHYQQLSRRMGMRQHPDRGDTDVQQMAPY